MFSIGSAIKWVAIAAMVAGVLAAGRGIYNYHLDQIQQAKDDTRTEIVLQQTLIRENFERDLKEQSEIDKEIIKEELKQVRAKSQKLERMLLIDHDLDRLLQRKPGLIVTRVNDGTEAYFKALEEATQ